MNQKACEKLKQNTSGNKSFQMFHTHTHTHKSRIYIQNPLMTPTFLIAWLEIHALWCDGEKSNETLTNKIHTVQSSLYLSSAMQMSRPGHYWPVMTPSVTLVQPMRHRRDVWWACSQRTLKSLSGSTPTSLSSQFGSGKNRQSSTSSSGWTSFFTQFQFKERE